MRSRPLLVTLVAAVALVTALAGPAPGVPVRTRVLPDTMQALSDACFTGTADGSVAVVTTPVDPGTGTGSLQLRQRDPDDVVGITRPFDLLSTFHGASARVWDADAYGASWYDASTWVDIEVVRAGSTYHLLKPWKPQGTTPWYFAGALPEDQYHVRLEDDGGWVPLASGDTITVPAFIAQYGDGPGELRILRAPCFAAYAAGTPVGWEPPPGLGTDTYLDLVEIRFGDTYKTYDFEDHLVRLSMSVGQTLITAGDSVQVSGGVTRDGARYGGLPVELQGRRKGEDWRTVGTTTSSSKGRVALKVHPHENTHYRWYYAAGNVQSPSLEVKVRTRLGIEFDDATLHTGDTLVVTGSLLPADDGTPISLMRRTASGPVQIGRGFGQRRGFYVISVYMREAGTYKLFVTTPATDVNERGSSVTKKVTVR